MLSDPSRHVDRVLSPGIDSEGHAANYVETEQIVQHNSAKASLVQVRSRPPPCPRPSPSESIRIADMLHMLFFTDQRLHPLLLVAKAQPQVQAETSDQQNGQPCKCPSHIAAHPKNTPASGSWYNPQRFF